MPMIMVLKFIKRYVIIIAFTDICKGNHREKEKANSEEKEVKEAKEVKAQKNAETASSKAADKAPAEKNVTKVGSLLKEMRIQKG